MSQVVLIRPQSITQIGTFTKFDSTIEDYLAIDPARCSGFGDAPLRTVTYDAPGLDGVLIFPPKDGAQVLTIAADLIVTSNGMSSEAGYFEAVDALYADFKAAIDALKTAPDVLVHSAGEMMVWKHGPVDPTWLDFWRMSVTFSLIQDVFA